MRRRRRAVHLPEAAVRQRQAERQDLVRLSAIGRARERPGAADGLVEGESTDGGGVAWDASGWKVHAFDPSPNAGAVLAKKERTSGGLAFEDACGNRYEWVGELKAEFAQRVASAFAGNLSRPARR